MRTAFCHQLWVSQKLYQLPNSCSELSHPSSMGLMGVSSIHPILALVEIIVEGRNSLPGVILSPTKQLAISEETLWMSWLVGRGGGRFVLTPIEKVGAKNASKHPTRLRTTPPTSSPPPTKINYLVQKVNNAKVEKLWYKGTAITAKEKTANSLRIATNRSISFLVSPASSSIRGNGESSTLSH